MLATLLVATLLQAQAAGPATAAAPQGLNRLFTPDTVLRDEAGRTVVLTSTPTPGMTAVRVFVPVAEQAGEEGLGRIMAQVVRELSSGATRRAGLRLDVSRTSTGISYGVEVPDADVDRAGVLLGQVLRQTPDHALTVRRIAGELAASAQAAGETGLAWVQASLLQQICPAARVWLGNERSLSSATPARVAALWSRTHTRGSAVVTVATGLPRAVVLAAIQPVRLGGRPSPTAATGPAPGVSAPERPREILRSWAGRAWRLSAEAGPEARVLGRTLSRGSTGSQAPNRGRTEAVWQVLSSPCGPVLMGVASAYPRTGASLTAWLESDPAETLDALASADVAAAAAMERTEALLAADTPAGRASAVGSSFEGGPDAAALLSALEAVRLPDLVSLLRTAAGGTGATVRLQP